MRRKRDTAFGEDGFEKWGGYMNAKIAKLEEQYAEKATTEENKQSSIFKGVSIFVNGYTKPSADQLKCIMSEHGGVYHHYFRSNATKFIIASNLPDTKVKNLPSTKIVKPEWISDSVKAGALLDYKQYILITNRSKTQPSLNFAIEKNEPTSSKITLNKNNEKSTAISDKLDQKLASENKESGPMKTAMDPKFLLEFYNNSRLHHISQLGATFKDYVNELRSLSDFIFPLRDRLRQSCASNTVSGNRERNKIIMHIDMDCFFVSVGLRKHPHLKGQPVAVTHAKTTKGVETRQERKGVDRELEFEMYRNRLNRKIESRVDGVSSNGEFSSMSEIASCSYEARAMGLRNGMFVGAALRLCPNLKTIPYDFEDYKEVAFELYNTIAQYTLDIEAVSCDEMYVDCTELLFNVGLTPREFASKIRAEIKEKTNCCCSVGFGENRLQARLATKKAKPDGQFHLEPSEVESFFADVELGELPGIGRQMKYKLNQLGFTTCGSMQSTNVITLKKHFGLKTSELLYNYCRGIDTRPLNFNTIRKSVSAAANYGIRFTEQQHCEDFLKQLCQEVHSRMVNNKVLGKSVTLKVMVRAANAPIETAKFMGHGVCDNITKTINLPSATDNLDIITDEVIKVSRKLNVKPEDWRGIGVQISKLQFTEIKEANKTTGIQSFFNRPPAEEVLQNKVENEKAAQKCLDRLPAEETEQKIKVNESVEKKPVKTFTLGLRRRGRPPKNALNAKPVVNAPKPAKVTEKSNNTAKKKSDNLDGIDKDVFDALPEDIKKEILANINQFRNKSDAPKEKSKDVQALMETRSPVEANEGLRKTGSDVEILNLDWEQIRDMLKIWMQSSESPLQCDVTLITMYLQNSIARRKIEDVYCLINFTYRNSLRLGRCDWHRVYLQLLESVQTSMLMIYGKKMSISKTFQCCQ